MKKQGYHILARNWRGSRGEIDVVASKAGFLVFLEVKYRTTLRLGDGTEAVGPAKQRALIRAAREFLHRYPEKREPRIRFDVVTITREGGLSLNHYKDAFWT